MVAGWPIAHHVWAGNTRDSKTVAAVVKDLTQRFQFRRAVFVGDRGMVTEKNLDVLRTAEGDWGFLLGMTRRQNPEAEALIDQVVENRWLDCPGGINAQEGHRQATDTRAGSRLSTPRRARVCGRQRRTAGLR